MKSQTYNRVAFLLFILVFVPSLAAAQEGIISGTVIIASGQGQEPVDPELTLSFYNAEGELVDTVPVGENGRFEAVLPAGEYRLVATAPGLQPFDTGSAVVQVTAGRDTRFDINMKSDTGRENSVTVSGTVLQKSPVGGPEPQPAVGADVTATGAADNIEISTVAGPTGQFSLNLEPDEYTILFEYAGYLDYSHRLVITEESQVPPLTITLIEETMPTSTVRGTISESRAGRLENGMFALRSRSDAAVYLFSLTDLGYFERQVPPGTYTVGVLEMTGQFQALPGGPVEVPQDRPLILDLEGRLPGETGEAESASATATADSYSFSLGDSYAERHVWFKRITEPGTYFVSASWDGDIEQVTIMVESPLGRIIRHDGETAPLDFEFTVTAQDVAADSQWKISAVNFSGGSARNGVMRIEKLTTD